MKKSFRYYLQCLGLLACILGFQNGQSQPAAVSKPGWPSVASQTKPWSRWWWHGNALTKEGITAEMEAYQKAGLGGLEITPIYGVVGYENKFIDFLSPAWMDLLEHTLKEAGRLNMGIDMATGTGWPFGGPWVSDSYACKDMNYKVYEVKGGTSLSEKIEFIQQPYLRAVGNPVYGFPEVSPLDPRTIDIKKLAQPISDNKDLQRLALDQVKFERPLKLKALMAYGSSNEVVNLTDKVDTVGLLNWTAPAGDWKLYAVFEGFHGKMVERAGPGGEGNVIDHFSSDALKLYLHHFDHAFDGRNIKSLRGFFNDSYEVDDARGAADWTPRLFEEFKKIKGYDLRDHLPALFGKDEPEKNKRILCDYRETISKLLLKNFTEPWKVWAHQKQAIVRNQAHGSPSNILDLYATVDIPEIEGIEPLRIRMASSAGNVTGKKLVSSESVTWLNEHFLSNLGDMKIALDRFMLNGVNHIFYHGTSYSPPGETWPGWVFYAAVHVNPRNPLWKDFDALNGYVARCQSFLQITRPDNDILLYYPIYDRFSAPGPEMIEHFDGIGRLVANNPFANTAFERAAETMAAKGYSFDYISDKQIEKTSFATDVLKTEGNSRYKTLIIPHGEYVPISTFQKIISLAEAGAKVIMVEGIPAGVAGFGNLEKNRLTFQELVKKLGTGVSVKEGVTEMKVGTGSVLTGENIDALLTYAGVQREIMVDQGIQYIRKKKDGQSLYFIANDKDQVFNGWIPFRTSGKSAVLYDPMVGNFGTGRLREIQPGQWEVFVQLAPKQTLIIETSEAGSQGKEFNYYESVGTPTALRGKWKITFESGGPKLPSSVEKDSLTSWTKFGDAGYPEFSGTASYTLSFSKPKVAAKGWWLDLGAVKESAEVFLNKKLLGTLIGPSYQVYIPASALKESNVLEVKVSNLMANRIADLDKRKVPWKKFYNVNVAARRPENRKGGIFDASGWEPKDSGLLGPVRLLPCQ